MFKSLTAVTSLILLLAGCGKDQPDTQHKQVTEHLSNNISCRIALTEDSQTDANNAVRQYQHAVSQNQQPLVNLEKLGWAYVSLARNTYDDGYFNLALETSRCIQSRYNGQDEALMLEAYIAHQLHKFKEAEELARNLVDRRGYWFEYGLLGDALLEQGRLVDAEQAYQAMMNQRPGPQAYSRAAHLRWLMGDMQGAIEMAQLTAQTYGHGNNEPANWARTRLGYYLLLDGDLPGSRQIIDLTLKLNNNYAPALFISGRLHLAHDDVENAVSVLERAVELNPAPEYQWVLIEAMIAAGQHEQARLATKQFEKTAKSLDPRTYALYLATTGLNSSLALELAAEQAIRQQDIFTQDALAWSLHANNQTSSAMTQIKKALENNTHDARLFYHAAVINLAAGERSQAGKWFAKARDNLHMLLPSERLDLETEFANFVSQNPPLETDANG